MQLDMLFNFKTSNMYRTNEPWWPSGLECYAISNAIEVMLEVEGSNLGASVNV